MLSIGSAHAWHAQTTKLSFAGLSSAVREAGYNLHTLFTPTESIHAWGSDREAEPGGRLLVIPKKKKKGGKCQTECCKVCLQFLLLDLRLDVVIGGC